MSKREFAEKYRDTIASMWDANEGKDMDILVTAEKLIYMVKSYQGEVVPEDDVYPGIPEDFDYDACYEDIKTLV